MVFSIVALMTAAFITNKSSLMKWYILFESLNITAFALTLISWCCIVENALKQYTTGV